MHKNININLKVAEIRGEIEGAGGGIIFGGPMGKFPINIWNDAPLINIITRQNKYKWERINETNSEINIGNIYDLNMIILLGQSGKKSHQKMVGILINSKAAFFETSFCFPFIKTSNFSFSRLISNTDYCLVQGHHILWTLVRVLFWLSR